MKHVIIFLFSLVTISGMAQTESGEEISPDEKLKWSVGGFFMLMAPYADDSYYEKDEERYVPQTTTVWLGSTRLSDGILKGSQSPFHLRNGFLKQQEGGVTFLQFSRNLYRGIAICRHLLCFQRLRQRPRHVRRTHTIARGNPDSKALALFADRTWAVCRWEQMGRQI